MARVSTLCHSTVKLLGISAKDGQLALIMRRYPASLMEHIERQPGGRLPPARCLLLARDLLRCLVELHAAGVAAADLQPGHVLLDEAGVPLLRLGLSHAGAVPGDAAAVPAGVLNYMAPEQFQDERGAVSGATERSDMWALAATLLHALTGAAPWAGRSLAQIALQVGIRGRAPPLPSTLPPALRSLLSACLLADPRARPRAAEALQLLNRELERGLQAHLEGAAGGAEARRDLPAAGMAAAEVPAGMAARMATPPPSQGSGSSLSSMPSASRSGTEDGGAKGSNSSSSGNSGGSSSPKSSDTSGSSGGGSGDEGSSGESVRGSSSDDEDSGSGSESESSSRVDSDSGSEHESRDETEVRACDGASMQGAPERHAGRSAHKASGAAHWHGKRKPHPSGTPASGSASEWLECSSSDGASVSGSDSESPAKRPKSGELGAALRGAVSPDAPAVAARDGRHRASVGSVGEMRIHVKHLDGTHYELTVHSHTLVSLLKHQITSRTGTPFDQQRLIFAGAELQDDWCLGYQGVTDGSTVHLVLKLRGGKPVICLWPAQPTDVHVSLRLSERWSLSSVVPRPDGGDGSRRDGGSGGHNDGAGGNAGGGGRQGWKAGGRSAEWRVRALPDGTLVQPASGGHEYAYLFWEALTEPGGGGGDGGGGGGDGDSGGGGGGGGGNGGSSIPSRGGAGTQRAQAPGPRAGRPAAAFPDPALAPPPPDLPLPDFRPERSFCVPGGEAEAWLYDVLASFGLPVRERSDFLTYWLPHMEGAPWLRIAFADPRDVQAAAALAVSPAPDVLVRVFMLFERLAAPVAASGCLAAEVRRVGVLRREGARLAVLEWGGMEVVRGR